ncbi:hypothetical protein [Halodesulfovibrio sp.]|uniref:hypothetical protein n=1 Tax=Halodesulfovibrio sp. TaxID=1912772 RepID=UPI0025F6B576|nr:hypothetical protein [Halodesulfovibrio sp.]
MRNIFRVLLLVCLFLWTGCSGVHHQVPLETHTAAVVSKAPSQIFVVQFADVFIDEKPVTEAHIKDAIRNCLEAALNNQNSVETKEEFFVFTFSQLEWVGNDVLQIQKKKSIRKNSEEVRSLVRTYTVKVQINHDVSEKEYVVRLIPNQLVVEKIMPECCELASSGGEGVTECEHSRAWGAVASQDIDIADAVSSTAQDLVDYNKTAIHHSTTVKNRFFITLDGDPRLIRKLFAAYMREQNTNAVITNSGVFLGDKQLVCMVDSANAVTFLWDVDLPQYVGLKSTAYGDADVESRILSLIKHYLTLS